MVNQYDLTKSAFALERLNESPGSRLNSGERRIFSELGSYLRAAIEGYRGRHRGAGENETEAFAMVNYNRWFDEAEIASYAVAFDAVARGAIPRKLETVRNMQKLILEIRKGMAVKETRTDSDKQ